MNFWRLPEKVFTEPEDFSVDARRWRKSRRFSIESLFPKCFTENVKFSYGMLAKMFDQNSITFCSRIENVRNFFHPEFILTHGFLWLSSVQFSKLGQKVFAIEVFADCQKRKTRVFFKENCLVSSYGHLECRIDKVSRVFLEKSETFPFSGRKWLKKVSFSEKIISSNCPSWLEKSVLKPRQLLFAKCRSISAPCPTLGKKFNFITIRFFQMLHRTYGKFL